MARPKYATNEDEANQERVMTYLTNRFNLTDVLRIDDHWHYPYDYIATTPDDYPAMFEIKCRSRYLAPPFISLSKIITGDTLERAGIRAYIVMRFENGPDGGPALLMGRVPVIDWKYGRIDRTLNGRGDPKDCEPGALMTNLIPVEQWAGV